jgi:GH35 family endo-1,4-beta-xylanase
MSRQAGYLCGWFYALALSCSPVNAQDAVGAGLDQSIQKARTGTLVVEAAPGVEVHVQQVRHEFWFGAALASQFFGGRAATEDAARYKKAFLDNFNAAVTENALKWHAMERRRGEVDYSVVNAILQWTTEHDIPLRGHNIFWGVPNMVQPWLKGLDDTELLATVKARAMDIGRRYRGRFAEYDLNNEMLHGNYYEQRLGPGITRDMALWVRQEDPAAVLYLNDYDILTGRRLDDYAAQIRKFLDQGVPIGGIGVQGHLHGDSFDPAVLKGALDRLGQFNLPIRITEFNFPGQRSKYYGKRGARLTDEEERAKAKALVDYYRICFANPAVEGILMWGFWEGANWIPVSSFYRRDWSPTPAAEAYRDLVFRQWWTTWRGKADAQGRCQLRAFFGKYRVTAGDREVAVDLKRREQTKTVSFKQP